jgi:murein DD-endopeptidase MepM/ murein hydrolase activator NlpD
MNTKELFSQFSFHPVIHLPADYEIFDFTKGYDPNRMRESEYGIGKYHEKRVNMYTTELFTQDPENLRDIHMGIDIAATAGTAVHAFYEGTVFCAAINEAAGDYGGTIITEHVLHSQKIWVLHGHLSHASVHAMKAQIKFKTGDVIAHLGTESENGGWNPHLHFQISLDEPVVCDMPGAVSSANLEMSLRRYPDPTLILGKLY